MAVFLWCIWKVSEKNINFEGPRDLKKWKLWQACTVMQKLSIFWNWAPKNIPDQQSCGSLSKLKKVVNPSTLLLRTSCCLGLARGQHIYTALLLICFLQPVDKWMQINVLPPYIHIIVSFLNCSWCYSISYSTILHILWLSWSVCFLHWVCRWTLHNHFWLCRSRLPHPRVQCHCAHASKQNNQLFAHLNTPKLDKYPV